jgi:hypothetical protein
MSELKAMSLVGIGTFLLFAALVAAILMLHAPSQLVAAAMGLAGLVGSFALVKVIRYLEVVDRRRKREEILLR